MVPPVTLPALAGLSAVLSAALSVASYRQRGQPGACALAALTASAAVWSASYAAALVTFDPVAREAMEALVYLGRGSLPVAWVVFAASYAGISDRFDSRHLLVACVVPIAALVATATAPLHDLVWTDYRIVGTEVAAVAFDPGALFLLHVGYSYLLLSLGTVVIAWALDAADDLLSVRGAMFGVGTGLAVVANLSWALGVFPVRGVDPTPMALSVTCALFGAGLVRFDLFDSSPAPRILGRRMALDALGDPLLIADRDCRVVDANRAAVALFDSTPVDRTVWDLVGTDEALEPGRHHLELRTRDGYREFAVSISPVRNRFGHTLGHTFLLQDVTDRRHREQRLAVLSRVLRHNLRNDVNVIRGHANEVTGVTPSDDRSLSVIERSADRLAALSRKAATVERVVGAREDAADPVPTDVGAVVAEAVDVVSRRYPTVTFVCDIEAGTRAVAAPEVVLAVAEESVENAAKHGASRVSVEVAGDAVASTDDCVRFAVSDDGPGLPGQERETLLSDTEAPLRHSSGLGLWIVRWGVAAVGGRLSVDSSDEGTRIEVLIPRDTGDDPRETIRNIPLPGNR